MKGTQCWIEEPGLLFRLDIPQEGGAEGGAGVKGTDSACGSGSTGVEVAVLLGVGISVLLSACEDTCVCVWPLVWVCLWLP